MKTIFRLVLSTALYMLAVVACTHKDDMDHINLSVNEIHAPKMGLTETVTGNNSFGFYLIKEQGDTIYWVNDASYQEQSEQNGYEFDETSDYIVISGNNMIIKKMKALDFTVKLGPNPYEKQRIITFVVMPGFGDLGRMDSLKITQDY